MVHTPQDAMPATPPRPVDAESARPKARGLLLLVAAAVVVLGGVFGYVTLRHRDAYRAYRAATLESGELPWATRHFSVDECVQYGTDWGLACPGVESWCAGDAPRVTLMCLESADRTEACATFGDEVQTNRLGFSECEAMRQDVEGRYTKRNHKKFCAASYRAVAEFCQHRATAPSR
jgi:hypothetical protein